MVIQVLASGMRIMLPSGNVVRLLRRERNEWVCVYDRQLSRDRGEVVFAGCFLRRGVRL